MPAANASPWPFTWGSRTYLMGIVNTSPDSFSGDGLADPAAAAALALAHVADGAHIVDIGGESTRPGHTPVSEPAELARVLPAIEAIVAATPCPVSIDTWKIDVARQALEAGASIVNDIWGLQRSPQLAGLAAAHGAGLVLMHNQDGTAYPGDIMDAIAASLRQSASIALRAGLPRERIILDPGIGFGKTWRQNLEVLRRLAELKALGHPLLVGASRKSTIGIVLGEPPDRRQLGTAATIALAIAAGADIVRVHDVADMAQVAAMSDAIVRGAPANPPGAPA